jgi:hypothetical protein
MSFASTLWEIVKRNKGIIIFFLILGLAIGIWSIYVQANDDGIIEGYVVDQSGRGLAQAKVLLQKKGYDILDEPIVTITDNSGYFLYDDTAMLEFVISAEKEGYASEGDRVSYHRYFMRHNFELPAPLQLIEEKDR